MARIGQPIEASADVKPGDASQRFSMHAFGAVFVEVAVDPDLAETRVRRIVGAYGAGRIINPKTARSQSIGGMIGGIGMALMEHSVVDARNGRIANANLAEYAVRRKSLPLSGREGGGRRPKSPFCSGCAGCRPASGARAGNVRFCARDLWRLPSL